MELDFEWVGGSRKTGEQLISMNPSLGRIVIYQKTMELIREKNKKDPKFVKLGITDKHPNAFWIKPCEGKDEGALKVHTMGNTRMISTKALFNRLKEEGWYTQEKKTEKFPVDWDETNQAIRVDLKQESDPQE